MAAPIFAFRRPARSRLRDALSFAYWDRPPEHGNRCWTYAAGYSLYFLESGWARFRFGTRRFQIASGEWGCLPAGQRRYQAFGKDTRMISVRFEASWEQGRPLFEAGLPSRFSRFQGRRLEAAAAALLGAMPPESEHGFGAGTGVERHLRQDAAWKGFLAEWVETLLALGLRPSAPEAADRRLAAAQRLLDEARPVTVVPYESLRRATGLGASQLDRLFRKGAGRTPKSYLDERSLQRAKQRLDQVSEPVKRLSAELGFSDPAHFSRWFRRLSGQTPMAYRKYGERHI